MEVGNSMIDNKENDNSTLITLTIFFSIFLICVIGMFVFYRIKNFSKLSDKNKINSIIKQENTNVIYLENIDLEVIISKLEDKNFIDLIMSKNNISEITNNELLYYLIKVTELHSQFGKVDNIPISVIDDIHNDSLFKNIVYKHNNVILNNNLLWAYNEENNIYVKNYIDKEFIVIPFFVRLDEINISDNNQYKISYKYAFKNINDNNVYGSYIDCLNRTNSIYFSNNSNNNELLKQELNLHYNDIKEKLNTYNYVVKNDNDKFILLDFNKT